MLKDLLDNSVGIDNTEFMHEQINFKKVNIFFHICNLYNKLVDKKVKNGEYFFITDVLKDIRKVILSCYSFYSARNDHTKKLLELEKLLEEKISYFVQNYNLLADVNLTFNLVNMEGKLSPKLRHPKDCYDSVLLQSVAHCRTKRSKKCHKTLSTTLTTDKDDAYILEKILSWENKMNFNDVFHQYINTMWELPEIGNFVAILFKKLNHDIISQGEIERMFLMPKESTTMGKIMTTLLMPVKKTKYIGQIMPYEVWSKKLSKKVSDWCKVYHTKKRNKVTVMNLLGIHPDFWAIVNERNPLIEKDYSELSYFIKVWLVKGLCDYVTIKFKTINDVITNCNERQCTIWKNNLETEEYFFFDSMPDLRIYYYNNPYDEPCLEFLKSVKTDKELVQFEDNQTLNGFFEGFHRIPKENNFKLIADSVEGLRAFVHELDMKGTSVPENLISSLKNFIVKIESKEYKYTAMNNESKIKLFKDWGSYPDRIQKNKDSSFWEEKDSKAIAQAKHEELIILEKRQRKLIVPQNVDMVESDEYVSENDKSLSDFTNSEDEWGAINQPKKKVKQPQQTSSKRFLELEKQVSQVNKMLEYDTNNQLDIYQSDKCNRHNKTSVCSKNVSLLKEKDSKPIAQADYKEIIPQKHIRKLVVRQNFETDKYCEPGECVDKSSSDFSDSKDKLGAMNQPKNKVKQPLQTLSKHLELKTRLSEEEKMLKYNTNQCEEKKLIDKDKISKHSINKVCKTNKKDKSIKSVKLLKTQNQVKCSNNTNTLVNCNNKIKQPLQTPFKCIKLEKCLKKDDTILRHRSNKVFDTNKKDKSIKSVKLLKNQNEVKYSDDTNTFVDGHNQRLICTKNIDIVCNYEEVALIGSDKKKNQKSLNGLRQEEIINIDDDMQNDCEDFNDNFESSMSTCTENKNRKTNKQDNYKQIEATVISIEDDEQTIIIDDEDDVQFVSMTVRPECSSLKGNKPCSSKTNLIKSHNFVSANRQLTPTNYIKHQATSTKIHKLSPNVTIMPVNVNIPKGIEVTMIETPQSRIDSNFNSIKTKSTISKGHPQNHPPTINVKCEIISKPNLNGEVAFYVKLPNGKEHPGPNELINQYLKQHNNQLPDYWLVPLPVEVAKQYGFN